MQDTDKGTRGTMHFSHRLSGQMVTLQRSINEEFITVNGINKQTISRLLNGLLGGLIVMASAATANPVSDAGLSDEAVERAVLLRDSAVEGTRAYEWVERLTTEVGPRLGGSEGEARARSWATQTLEALGFSNVHVDPFTIDGWLRGEERAAVIAPFPQPLAITALGKSIATPAEGVEAEVVMFENLAALRRADPATVKGKIVYTGHAMQATQDGSSYGHSGRLRREGPSEAARKGAIAIMIRSIGTDSHRMPHTGATGYDEDVTPIPAVALSNPDADQLERIASRGLAIRVALTITPRALGEVRSGNVIADIPGRESPEQIVIIGGHLDSWDLATGAIDDGAGVAITLEAARLILASGWQPRRTIRLVLWGSEELGLLGGRHYAEQHKAHLRQHVIGTESDFGAGKIWQMTHSVNDAAKPIVDLIGQLVAPLGVAPGADNVRNAGPDLTPMIQAGMPGFRFVQDGMDYFDLHHTPDDTLDKIDPANLDQNVAAFVVFTWLAAESEVTDWGWQ